MTKYDDACDNEEEGDGKVDLNDEDASPVSQWKSRQLSGGFCPSCKSRGLYTRSSHRLTSSSVGLPGGGRMSPAASQSSFLGPA